MTNPVGPRNPPPSTSSILKAEYFKTTLDKVINIFLSVITGGLYYLHMWDKASSMQAEIADLTQLINHGFTKQPMANKKWETLEQKDWLKVAKDHQQGLQDYLELDPFGSPKPPPSIDIIIGALKTGYLYKKNSTSMPSTQTSAELQKFKDSLRTTAKQPIQNPTQNDSSSPPTPVIASRSSSSSPSAASGASSTASDASGSSLLLTAELIAKEFPMLVAADINTLQDALSTLSEPGKALASKQIDQITKYDKDSSSLKLSPSANNDWKSINLTYIKKDNTVISTGGLEPEKKLEAMIGISNLFDASFLEDLQRTTVQATSQYFTDIVGNALCTNESYYSYQASGMGEHTLKESNESTAIHHTISIPGNIFDLDTGTKIGPTQLTIELDHVEVNGHWEIQNVQITTLTGADILKPLQQKLGLKTD